MRTMGKRFCSKGKLFGEQLGFEKKCVWSPMVEIGK
jgi:hypothetical protein